MSSSDTEQKLEEKPEEKAEEDTSIEKPAKTHKKGWTFTKARQEAFERCRKRREENLKTITKEKKVERLLKREEKIKQQKAELGVAEKEESESEVEVKVAKRKRKPKVTVIESDSSSSSDSEYEVRKVKKQRPSKVKYEMPPSEPEEIKPLNNIYFL